MQNAAPDLHPPAAPPAALRPAALLLRVLVMTFVVMTGAYAVSVAGQLVLRQVIGERWAFVALFNALVHLLVLPAPLLLIPALLLRKWAIALLLVPSVIAALVWYVPDLLPKSVAAADPNAPTLTVASFNIASLTTRMDEFTTLILSLDADVIGLQEVRTEAAADLLAALAAEYPHSVSEATDRPYHGQMVFSRYPIRRAEVIVSPLYVRHQRVEMDLNGRTVVVYNLHLAVPFVTNGFALRTVDAAAMRERALAETDPVILLGDFNLTPQSEDYARFSRAFTDAFRAAGQGMGFTYGPRQAPRFFPQWQFTLPIARIDYVFYGAGVRAVAMRVEAESVHSDHRPLVARLVLE